MATNKMGSKAQLNRIKAKVSGEPGRNALNILGTAGQTVKAPARKKAVDGLPATNTQRTGKGAQAINNRGPVRAKDSTPVVTNPPRNSRGSNYGGLPANKSNRKLYAD